MSRITGKTDNYDLSFVFDINSQIITIENDSSYLVNVIPETKEMKEDELKEIDDKNDYVMYGKIFNEKTEDRYKQQRKHLQNQLISFKRGTLLSLVVVLVFSSKESMGGNRKRTVYVSFGGLLLELSGEKTNLGLRKDTRVYFTLRKV